MIRQQRVSFLVLYLMLVAGGASVGCGNSNEAIKPEQIAPRPPADSAASDSGPKKQRSEAD